MKGCGFDIDGKSCKLNIFCLTHSFRLITPVTSTIMFITDVVFLLSYWWCIFFFCTCLFLHYYKYIYSNYVLRDVSCYYNTLGNNNVSVETLQEISNSTWNFIVLLIDLTYNIKYLTLIWFFFLDFSVKPSCFLRFLDCFLYIFCEAETVTHFF